MDIDVADRAAAERLGVSPEAFILDDFTDEELTQASWEDWDEVYADPERRLYVHHGYAFGKLRIVLPAVRRHLLAARKAGDDKAAEHLAQHLREYAAIFPAGKQGQV